VANCKLKLRVGSEVEERDSYCLVSKHGPSTRLVEKQLPYKRISSELLYNVAINVIGLEHRLQLGVPTQMTNILLLVPNNTLNSTKRFVEGESQAK